MPCAEHIVNLLPYHLPKATTLTTKTLCSSGTILKFTACTHGHSKKLFVMPGTQAFLSLSVGLLPSKYAMLDKKHVMFMGAKMNWSQATRAAMVRFVVEAWTREARKPYHFVAAGPKMAVDVSATCFGGIFDITEDVPPPYANMRPVLAGSWWSRPFFSTAC